MRCAWRPLAIGGLLALLLQACANGPAAPGGEGAAAAPGQGPDRTELSRPNSLGTVQIPVLDAVLQATARRLLQAAPPELPRPGGGGAGRGGEVRVRISASPGLGAWATDTTLYVPWRMLARIESDDELAALLAHELSHLLLGHTESDARTSMFGTFAAFGPLVAATPLAAVAMMVGGQYGDRALASRWVREQEIEADVLGVKLLQRAGIRRGAMLDLLDNLDGMTLRTPNATPDWVARRDEGHGKTSFTFTPGDMRFGALEQSHPDIDLRRDKVREALAAPPTSLSPSPASPAPPGAWVAAIKHPDAQAALQGLASAHQAVALQARRGTAPAPPQQRPDDTPAAHARRALASPVADSFVAWWAAMATLPPQEMAALGVQPVGKRLDRADTPIMGYLGWLALATEQGRWELAAQVGDKLRDRYELDRGLYKTLGHVYAMRAAQIEKTVAANINRLSGSDALSLNMERMKRDLQSGQMFMACLGKARAPGELAVACKD